MSTVAPTALARSRSGGTLVETMIAASLSATILAALATTCSVCLGMVRGQRETVASTLLLQERLEQLRSGGWSKITDPTALRDQVLGTVSAQERPLMNCRQQVTVSPYPSSNPAPAPLRIEKRSDGTLSILSQPLSTASLASRLSVRIDFRVEWTSRQNRRIRSREMSAVMSLGGLVK